MSQDEYDFISQNFEQTCPTAFRRLWTETKFSDVTLVSEDGDQISAHRVILVSCSLFFKDILSGNPHPHPLICLTGIKAKILTLVLEYIYLGSCKVDKGSLLPFLTAGRDLHVEGLKEPAIVDDGHLKMQARVDCRWIEKQLERKEVTLSIEDDIVDNFFDASQSEVPNPLSLEQVSTLSKPEEADELQNKFDVSRSTEELERKEFKCNECDYVSDFPHHLATHTKAKHASETFDCTLCDFKSQWKQVLIQHKKNMHERTLFPCNQCDFKAKWKGSVTTHIRNKHEKITNDCDICGDKSYTTMCSLKFHKKTVHEGIIEHNCDICEYMAKSIKALKSHKASAHEGVTYNCDECDHRSKTKHLLKIHQDNVHKGITYNCDECNHKSKSKHRLKRHKENTHSGLVHDCNLCSYKTNGIYKMKSHKKRQHDGVTHDCNLCEYKAIFKRGLQKHQEKVHE